MYWLTHRNASAYPCRRTIEHMKISTGRTCTKSQHFQKTLLFWFFRNHGSVCSAMHCAQHSKQSQGHQICIRFRMARQEGEHTDLSALSPLDLPVVRPARPSARRSSSSGAAVGMSTLLPSTMNGTCTPAKRLLKAVKHCDTCVISCCPAR